jgi:hypothetical protein
MIRTLSLTTVCLTLNSCAEIQYNYKGNSVPITSQNIHLLSGIYEDAPSWKCQTRTSPDLLWEQLTDRPYWKGRLYDTDISEKIGVPENYRVHLEVIKQKRITATLFLRDKQTVRHKKLPGKLKDGCYIVRKTTILPFFPLIFGYMTHSIRIGLTEEGIFVDSKWEDWGAALGFGGCHNWVNSASYARRN